MLLFKTRANLICWQRVDAAKPRIQSLNPLVQVDVISDDSTFLDDSKLDALVQSVDLVIVTDSDLSTMVGIPAGASAP